MRNARVAALALAALIAAAFALPSVATAAKKPKGPVVVGTDAAGDWGQAVDANIGPAGDALGQDLTEASVVMADKTTVNFIIKLNSLPPTGGMPEISRYTWDMYVDGEFVELDGKFTNYSRGACDPTSGQCDPTTGAMPRDPGLQPFMVRGSCGLNEAGVTVCQELGIVTAMFDAAAGTITIPVSLELLGGKLGSKIAPGINLFGGSVSATPAAFLSAGNLPLDTMVLTGTFVVPKK